MAFNTPQELQYARSHEWIRIEGETATIGITDYAQDALGDVVYIDLPEVGTSRDAEAIFGAVESVKAASDLYMPVAGEVIEVNEALIDNPEMINSDPYGAGWMIRIKVAQGVGALLSAEAYAAFVEEIQH
ncbi:MAG TPA: glycine cleavage system protein GcvH [Roseiflexaceae bacterium]|nr:glycine cleavage system protein GcvH [Roseiflexaceae bacterium]HMP39452.1 glycine cleavage system protein GcvH [Roseiflexaceae bacterium]